MKKNILFHQSKFVQILGNILFLQYKPHSISFVCPNTKLVFKAVVIFGFCCFRLRRVKRVLRSLKICVGTSLHSQDAQAPEDSEVITNSTQQNLKPRKSLYILGEDTHTQPIEITPTQQLKKILKLKIK